MLGLNEVTYNIKYCRSHTHNQNIQCFRLDHLFVFQMFASYSFLYSAGHRVFFLSHTSLTPLSLYCPQRGFPIYSTSSTEF